MSERHPHEFPEGWPFDEATNVAAFTTRLVLEADHPILLVSHDIDDGAWQMLCGTTNDPTDGRIACLGCLYERDPTLGEVADLPMGWRAWRTSRAAPWQRERRPNEDNEGDDGSS
jgi:hypothetical protein